MIMKLFSYYLIEIFAKKVPNAFPSIFIKASKLIKPDYLNALVETFDRTKTTIFQRVTLKFTLRVFGNVCAIL